MRKNNSELLNCFSSWSAKDKLFFGDVKSSFFVLNHLYRYLRQDQLATLECLVDCTTKYASAPILISRPWVPRCWICLLLFRLLLLANWLVSNASAHFFLHFRCSHCYTMWLSESRVHLRNQSSSLPRFLNVTDNREVRSWWCARQLCPSPENWPIDERSDQDIVISVYRQGVPLKWNDVELVVYLVSIFGETNLWYSPWRSQAAAKAALPFARLPLAIEL